MFQIIFAKLPYSIILGFFLSILLGLSWWLVTLVTIIILVVAKYKISNKKPNYKIYNYCIGYGLLLLMLSCFFYIHQGFSHHFEFGSLITKPEECTTDKIAQKWDSCQGRDFSFMQGRMYYAISSGTADEKLCLEFTNKAGEHGNQATENNPCDSSLATNWSKLECASIGEDSTQRCFSCGSFADTGDNYYNALVFSSNCKLVKKYSSANIDLKDIKNRMLEDSEKEQQEKTFYADLKRFAKRLLSLFTASSYGGF